MCIYCKRKRLQKAAKGFIIILIVSLGVMTGCTKSAHPEFNNNDTASYYGNEYPFYNERYIFYSIKKGGVLSDLYSGIQGTTIKQMDRNGGHIRDIGEGIVLGVTSEYVYYLTSQSASNSVWRCGIVEDADPEQLLYIDYDFQDISVYSPYVLMTSLMALDRLCIMDMRTGEKLANSFTGQISQCLILGDYVYISDVNGGLYREKLNSKTKDVVCPNTVTISSMLLYNDKIYFLQKDNVNQNVEISSLDKEGDLHEIINCEKIENARNEWKNKGENVKETEEDYFYVSNNKIYFSPFKVKDNGVYKDIFLSVSLDDKGMIGYEENVTDFVNNIGRKQNYKLLTIINDKVILCDDFDELYEHKNGNIIGPKLYLYDLEKRREVKIDLKSYSGEYMFEYYYAIVCLDRCIAY